MHAALPYPPELEDLQSFGVALALVGGAIVALVTWWLGVGPIRPWVLVGGAALLAFLVVLLGSRERDLRKLYELWNQASRAYSRRALEAVTRIWYFTVILAISRIGGERTLVTRGAWIPRSTLSPEAYEDPGRGSTRSAGSQREGGSYLAWSRDADRLWAILLLPLVAIVAALHGGPRRGSTRNIYTLY